MSELSEVDRDALMLRFFERKSLREVGNQLGVTDDAAQKRVSRAVEQLRAFFSKRGISVSAGALTAVISANAVQAAPVGLALSVSAATALAANIVTPTTMTWLNLKSAVAIVATALAAGTGTHLVQQASSTRFQAENQSLTAANVQLRSEFAAVRSELSATSSDVERIKADQNELLRLRGEVGVLRRLTNANNSVRPISHSLPRLSGTNAPKPYTGFGRTFVFPPETLERLQATVTASGDASPQDMFLRLLKEGGFEIELLDTFTLITNATLSVRVGSKAKYDAVGEFMEKLFQAE